MSQIEKTYPITGIQAGILFEISQHNYTNPVYVVQMIFAINKHLEIQTLLQAFSIVTQRHEALRLGINFDSTLHCFVQNIYNKIRIPSRFFDYRTLKKDKQSENFNSFLQHDLKDSFDLSKPPLMRLTFFKFSNQKYRIVWTRHHILLDGASVKAILKEVFTIYEALLKHKIWSLPKPISYEKIIQTQKLNYCDDSKIFWQKSLNNIINASSLPATLKNQKIQKKLHTQTIALNKVEFKKLRKFVDNNKLTINTLIEGTWGIVLSRYSGKYNVVFGSVKADLRKPINAVGLFINTLPIILQISPQEKIDIYLRNIHKKNQILKKYTATPLNNIKEWLHLSPKEFLYQSVINYNPYAITELTKEFFKNATCNVSLNLNIPYPLTLEVIKEKNTLTINLHYDASLFEEKYINSILLYFFQILKELYSSTNKTISQISTLPIQDSKKITIWNHTLKKYPSHTTIHQLFEKQVRKTPFKKALVYKNSHLSYEELNKCANQLAHHLIQSNVKLETNIIIFIKPNMNMMISVLAVLKAGGAFIPIDPTYPQKRIKHLIENSRTKIIITDTININFLDTILDNQKSNFLLINIDQFDFTLYPTINPNISVTNKSLMYVIYTSGSTGEPKGVMIEHHSAINMAFSCISCLKVTANSRILQISSFSFDVSVAEWCIALLSGATIYLIDKDIFSPDAIIKALKNYKITTIILSASILAALPKKPLPYLKVIASGGEICNQSTATFWAKKRLFLNVYGITEATICSTINNCALPEKNMSIIGKPLANTQIYILDENRNSLPIGVPGEIYIGGEGIGRGYFNNPQLTSEKFIEDSLKNKKYRFYKTGDLGRWLPSGQLEFIGRIDEQIKIRGIRIELQEIESVLEKHPAVTKAVVMEKTLNNNKQLHAYLSLKRKKTSFNEIKKFTQSELPLHMVPVKFFQVDQFPLTPNGKIDKEKLSSLNFKNLNLTISHEPTASIQILNIEETIFVIIESLLHIQNIPKNKNFFEIGFDSITLINFATELSNRLDVKIDVLTLFSHPTVNDLVEYIQLIHKPK